jgi:hypothetical protein
VLAWSTWRQDTSIAPSNATTGAGVAYPLLHSIYGCSTKTSVSPQDQTYSIIAGRCCRPASVPANDGLQQEQSFVEIQHPAPEPASLAGHSPKNQDQGLELDLDFGFVAVRRSRIRA